MTIEQARKEIIKDTLTNREQLRRAIIGEIDGSLFSDAAIGDAFLDALIMINERKLDDAMTADIFLLQRLALAAQAAIISLEDIAQSYANSVNIEE